MCTKPFIDCFSRLICRCYYITIWTCQIMSVVSLLFLNIDKFVCIYYPLHYRQIITEKVVAGQLFIAWTCTIAYTMFSYIGPTVKFIPHNETDCWATMDPTNYLLMISVGYILPSLISLLISIYIFIVAQGMSSNITMSTANRQNAKNRMIKRIMFVFSSTLWTSLTSLPYRYYMFVLYSK